MNPLAKVIKEETGKSIASFCETELQTQYKAFFARVRNERLYPAEIFYIVHRTKKPIQEIFGKPWHELLISGQGGELVEKVRGIIDGMTAQEEEEMSVLLGFDRYRAKAAEREAIPPATDDIRKYPPVEDAKPSEDNLIEKLFINTYNQNT